MFLLGVTTWGIHQYGNSLGGKKAARTNKERHGSTFYQEIGRMGGRKSRGGGFAANPELARIALVETNGWDTHNGQRGRLAVQLRGLDALITSLKAGLAADWSNTLVLVATEFGRTARINGTGGTDHGTGAMAMLMGGAVAGGRILADWPGLGPSALYDGRDLKPTLGLDALIASALAQHFGLDGARTAALLFPETKPKLMAQRLVT